MEHAAHVSWNAEQGSAYPGIPELLQFRLEPGVLIVYAQAQYVNFAAWNVRAQLHSRKDGQLRVCPGGLPGGLQSVGYVVVGNGYYFETALCQQGHELRRCQPSVRDRGVKVKVNVNHFSP